MDPNYAYTDLKPTFLGQPKVGFAYFTSFVSIWINTQSHLKHQRMVFHRETAPVGYIQNKKPSQASRQAPNIYPIIQSTNIKFNRTTNVILRSSSRPI